MLNLLEVYSVKDIIIFIVLLCLAVKGVISFYDWAKDKIMAYFGKLTKRQKMENSIEEIKSKVNNDKDKMDLLEKSLDKISNSLQSIEAKTAQQSDILKDMNEKVDILWESDRDDIKSYIVREYHYFTEQKKWIDDFSLECCEKRYQHYKDEGGNNYVTGLMEKLRRLPTCPPDDQ